MKKIIKGTESLISVADVCNDIYNKIIAAKIEYGQGFAILTRADNWSGWFFAMLDDCNAWHRPLHKTAEDAIEYALNDKDIHVEVFEFDKIADFASWLYYETRKNKVTVA